MNNIKRMITKTAVALCVSGLYANGFATCIVRVINSTDYDLTNIVAGYGGTDTEKLPSVPPGSYFETHNPSNTQYNVAVSFNMKPPKGVTTWASGQVTFNFNTGVSNKCDATTPKFTGNSLQTTPAKGEPTSKWYVALNHKDDALTIATKQNS